MRKKLLKTALMAVAGVALLTGSALAAPIIGGMGHTGTWTPIDADEKPTTIPLATGIDFGGYLDDESFSGNTFQVTSASGTFRNLGMVGKIGTINNFQFASTNVPLWNLDNFSFVMTSLSHKKSGQGDGSQLLTYGTGTISAPGFNETPGYWNYSGQGASDANFSWSASTGSHAPIPESATMLLFGAGLMGLAFIGRKTRQ